MKIIEYVLLKNSDRRMFNDEVNFHIEDGWQPFCSSYKYKACFYQSMVKYEKDKNETTNTDPSDIGW